MKHEDVQKQYEWSKKGKKYKTKYFAALKQLFGDINDDKDVQVESPSSTGEVRADSLCELAS